MTSAISVQLKFNMTMGSPTIRPCIWSSNRVKMNQVQKSDICLKALQLTPFAIPINLYKLLWRSCDGSSDSRGFRFQFGFLKMAMNTLSGSCSSDLSSLFRGAFYIIRNRLTSPEEVFSFRGISSSCTDSESFNLRVETLTLLAAEKKEAKSVLTLFLMQQGLSKAVAARTVNKSDYFIDHIISRLHSAHISRYLVGRELTALEIGDTLNPYLQSLLEEHGNFLVVKNFHTAPIKKSQLCQFVNPIPALTPRSQNQSLISRQLHADILGLPATAWRGKSNHWLSFFLILGVEDNLRPTAEYFKSLGVDVAIVLHKSRRNLGLSIEGHLKPATNFFWERGFSVEEVRTNVLILLMYILEA
ncbi:hypothetical protein Pint_26807 [Pistacia integerrima]|uniref:Uncharacterized protein n=1 Tax=Pistacia integerrima TaxID=434235 RepID=A0ACC0YTS1_9ROSI|nr:hypothetical protein Pint_26807 [Pistacia integerrima]